ncbi:MAG: hypothetical protein KME27_12515 [Lyngbya sp. HA4199-MV5]|jgi:membrane protein implicated in regulation of membrane protease activity|nr:hypothetical protein [Lyngbya sp. HA4199-MV5]
MIELMIKVFALSTALSIAIKYGAPVLSIAPAITTVLIAVWLPTTIMTVILTWRWQQRQAQEGSR